jgi:hypothetical protein
MKLETNILADAPRVMREDRASYLNEPTVTDDRIHRDDLPKSQIAPAFQPHQGLLLFGIRTEDVIPLA